MCKVYIVYDSRVYYEGMEIFTNLKKAREWMVQRNRHELYEASILEAPDWLREEIESLRKRGI